MEYDKLRSVAPAFRKAYSWDRVLAPFCQLVSSLLEAPNEIHRKKLLQGNLDEYAFRVEVDS